MKSRRTKERPYDVVATASLVALIGFAAYAFASLPNAIPVHFDFGGRATGWGPKATVLILPASGLLTFAIVAFVKRFGVRPNPRFLAPEGQAEAASVELRVALSSLRATIVIGMLVLEWQIVASARAGALAPGFMITVFLFVASIVLVAITSARRIAGTMHDRPEG